MRGGAAPIRDVFAWEALDSRGNPTVACVVRAGLRGEGQAIVPSGASTGTHEALELRDGGRRYGGRGVRTAVGHVNELLGPAVVGLDATDQAGVDAALQEADGGPGFSRLGANAALAVSLAAGLAGASVRAVPPYVHFGSDGSGEPVLLPMPMVNVVSGGAHAGGAVDVQDYLVVPLGATSFAEAIEWAARVRAATAAALGVRGHDTTLVADEGGVAARLASNRAPLEVLTTAIDASGLRAGHDVGIAIDVAATQLWIDGEYRLAAEGRSLSAEDLVTELAAWCDEFPIVSIEDALADDDHDGWVTATTALGERTQLVGDDLFVTDEGRLATGIENGVANSVLVKPNQTGTLSAARRVVELARRANYATVLSARSGETEDSWLADVACAWRGGQIKVGSTMRSERTAKWNRLLRIEAELERAGTPAVLARFPTEGGGDADPSPG